MELKHILCIGEVSTFMMKKKKSVYFLIYIYLILETELYVAFDFSINMVIILFFLLGLLNNCSNCLR